MLTSLLEELVITRDLHGQGKGDSASQTREPNHHLVAGWHFLTCGPRPVDQPGYREHPAPTDKAGANGSNDHGWIPVQVFRCKADLHPQVGKNALLQQVCNALDGELGVQLRLRAEALVRVQVHDHRLDQDGDDARPLQVLAGVVGEGGHYDEENGLHCGVALELAILEQEGGCQAKQQPHKDRPKEHDREALQAVGQGVQPVERHVQQLQERVIHHH
mmetsp:Transcript_60016/g.107053  ORF Transcript_60016/g.107053 Transcript_60016/m.107053 type:complete len:218 (-) Transcript_60016:918-1571(-)